MTQNPPKCNTCSARSYHNPKANENTWVALFTDQGFNEKVNVEYWIHMVIHVFINRVKYNYPLHKVLRMLSYLVVYD